MKPLLNKSKRIRHSLLLGVGGFMVLLLGTPRALSEIPTVLTDKVYRGQGVIDLLKDVSGAELEQYFQERGQLLLAVDLNEDASGNESSDSIGVAIKEIELVITTTAGDFTFNEFFTSTTAMIQEAGTDTAQEFYTLFGTSGSSTITGGTVGFDLSKFDDVLYLDNVSLEGTILSAKLNVKFLDTARTGSEGNETFFDWSDGFEDFALVSEPDATALETANIGVEAAPTSVSYTSTPLPSGGGSATPGAPAPPLVVLAALAIIVAWKARQHGQS